MIDGSPADIISQSNNISESDAGRQAASEAR